jgi:hypothetical protein
MLPIGVNVMGFAATSALSIVLWALSMKKEDDPRKFYKETHT